MGIGLAARAREPRAGERGRLALDARGAGPARLGPVLFGMGRGHVRYLAVADRRLLRDRRALRRDLRRAGG